MKKIGIINLYNIHRLSNVKYERIIYLSENYFKYKQLKDILQNKNIKIENLSSVFDVYYLKIIEQFIDKLNDIGKQTDKIAWWSGDIASRSTTSSPLIRDIIYSLYSRDLILDKDNKSILFICENVAIMKCIKNFCVYSKLTICEEKNRFWFNFDLKISIVAWLCKITLFILQFYYSQLVGKCIKFPIKLINNSKCIILRSWITNNTIDNNGKYADRNFGQLPEILKELGYIVTFIPMMFNLGISLRKQFKNMLNTNENFLIPVLHSGMFSWFFPIIFEYKRLRINLQKIDLLGMDICYLIKYYNKKNAFRVDMMLLNLIYPLIRKLKRKKIHVDQFIYSFENLSVEKLFLLSIRKYYSDTAIKGFQHTIIVSQQAATQLIKSECNSHPLPDEIICSGNAYINVLSGLNFPTCILKSGPSLRFSIIKKYPVIQKKNLLNNKINIFVPLPYCQNRSYEMLDKLHKTVLLGMECVVYIKPHPLTNRKKLKKFIAQVKELNCIITDETCISMFAKTDISVFVGTSVVQFEAAASGIPVVRIIPDNTFNLDPMHWYNYPVKPACKPAELFERIHEGLHLTDKERKKISDEIKTDYFTEGNFDNISKAFAI